MEDTLGRADVERFERLLRAKQAELQVELADLAEAATEVAEAAGESPADGDVGERGSGIDLSLATGQDALLRDVDDALERIRAGTFGRCETCGRWIERERLELLPYAPLCAACARAAGDAGAA